MLTQLIKPILHKTVPEIIEYASAQVKNREFYDCIITYYTHYYKTLFKFDKFYKPFSESYTAALSKRKQIKLHTPLFRRYLRKRFMRLSRTGWRKPRGLHNKLRKHIKGKGAHPKIGYRKPALVRCKNAKGYTQYLCKDLTQMETLLQKTVSSDTQYMIVIASTIGLKKRVIMENLAHANQIYVSNKYKWENLLCNSDN